jgi:uncharacterized protein with PIN domain
MNEFDIPCSDCGSTLEERTIPLKEISTSPPIDDQVSIAECPECGARYYPEETLSRLPLIEDSRDADED